ncbi:zinc-dependent peptidase [Nitratiruptor sp. YY09-18]|uniref:M90 family metallopeptidase n=1 Tax=Nitratiruptor sp. YY09-18 TaxID=2724901 RepID=UPI0019150A98|nr:M90 family metallopeptidase [Nitratiruptor sp. YY09-18]BCD67335.1 MtfA peptidase [Nitratiruptor sp. YY09-18]
MDYYLLLLSLFGFILFAYVLYQLYLYLVTDARYHLLKTLSYFPKRYEAILLKEFPFYLKIPPQLQRRLKACILTFIKEKEFIGRGVNIDEEKRVIIAANACLLTIGHDRCEYKHVKSIFIYPEAVFKKEKIEQGWIVTEQDQVLLGEAWQGGEVILSWKDVLAGDLNPHNGKNVALHEFAHQLDMADGVADGTPPLPLKLYKKWAQIMTKEYKKLHNELKHHHKSFLDPYAATNAAEFFAVATEYFFEKPKKLQKEEPQLYEILKEYYNLDPASWE